MTFLVAALLITTISVDTQGQEVVLDSSNYKKYIRSLPAFTMYGDNYFVTGISLNEDITSETSDAKFEIGFKQRLTNVDLPWDVFPFITYRQKSFWNIYLESFPFRETNYNPALGLAKLFVNDEGIQSGLWFAFEHESNGRDGENSRSWNYFALQYFKPYGTDWQFRAKVWIPAGDLSDNEDITSFRGFFALGATYSPVKNLFFDMDIQPAYDDKLTGFIKAGLSFKISKNSNQFVYLQYFGGYSEDLFNYNQDVSNLRIGIAFKDLMMNFRTHNN
ncbi:phospholipase A [Poritiphilus flavus]|uniref:Phosphatidylcholine 1-acylhydrolase n=1 Tax=Poritiphilus flavus TaxID=2697053 RepID=A0A6L9EBR5_9FLAO|nr:phospholipase A [Poritiphilus flavus]NAS12186.1 phospholipase [Poritiphilus flavus]